MIYLIIISLDGSNIIEAWKFVNIGIRGTIDMVTIIQRTKKVYLIINNTTSCVIFIIIIVL